MSKDQRRQAPWIRIKKELADAQAELAEKRQANSVLTAKVESLQQALDASAGQVDSYRSTGSRLLEDLKYWEAEAKRPFWKRLTKI